MMQDWAPAASYHQSERAERVWQSQSLLLHVPKSTSLHMHASLGLSWCTLQGSESLYTGV